MAGYAGLIVSYIILISLFLYILIKLRGKWFIKAICIFVFIYYSIAMAYSINSIMGWPTSGKIPRNARIIWIQIQEPHWIYFWLQTEWKDDDIFLLDPRKVFEYHALKEPRIFKIPYTKEQHKKILEAMRQKKGMPGSQIITKGKKGDKKGKTGRQIKDSKNLEYKVLNPFELFPKG